MSSINTLPFDSTLMLGGGVWHAAAGSAKQVDERARLEALDVGKPLPQRRRAAPTHRCTDAPMHRCTDALALARLIEFYGGAAAKAHGQTGRMA